MTDSTRSGADRSAAPQDPPQDTAGDASLVGITVSRHAGATVVLAVRGEIDMGTAPELADAMAAAVAEQAARVFVEMSQVRFLGVAGVRVLARAARDARAAGAELAVADPAHPASRILRLVGLDGELLRPEPLARLLATTERGDGRS